MVIGDPIFIGLPNSCLYRDKFQPNSNNCLNLFLDTISAHRRVTSKPNCSMVSVCSKRPRIESSVKLNSYQVLCILFLSLLSHIGAASTQAPKELKETRDDFLKAEYLAKHPKSRGFRRLVKNLRDYPLYPYIELKTLMRYPYLSNKGQISRFLEKYENTPMDRPLRNKWLKYLDKKKQKALFLHFYRDTGNASLTCTYLKYQLERPEFRQQALEKIDQLWLVGKSQPKSCDPVFKQWQKAGRRTHDMVWKRLVLAADGGKHTLIPYLKKLLPANEQYLADLWYKTRRDPSYVSRPSRFPGKMPEKEAEILAYGLKRLIWRDRDLALKSWEKLNKRVKFNQQQRAEISGKFALGLAIKNHPKADEWLTRANQLQSDKELYRWYLAHELRQQKWQSVLDIIESAPQELKKDLFFSYWHARSLQEINGSPEAEAQLKSLAEKRHYYGFLASGHLGKKAAMDDSPLQFTDAELKSIEDMPGAKRAKEFLALKRYASARKEWIYLQRKLTKRQQQMAAVVAHKWNWHDQAIFTFSRSGYLNDVKKRFPLAFKQEVMEHAEKQHIPAAWAFAIARKESSFMVDANSGAGARGLMQLLPGTARYLAKKRVKQSELFEPETNVKFGTQYLRYLMNKTDENSILATAAYNAGWRRVKDWGPEDKSLPVDVWIETIPYKETRDYVKSVMAYQQIYLQLLGSNRDVFKELVEMELSEDDFSF